MKPLYDPVQEEIVLRNMRIASADQAIIVNPYYQKEEEGHASWMAYFKPGMSPGVYRNYSANELRYHASWDWFIPAATRIIDKYMQPLHGNGAIISLLDYEDAIYANDISKAVEALDKFIKSMVPDYFKEEKLDL